MGESQSRREEHTLIRFAVDKSTVQLLRRAAFFSRQRNAVNHNLKSLAKAVKGNHVARRMMKQYSDILGFIAHQPFFDASNSAADASAKIAKNPNWGLLAIPSTTFVAVCSQLFLNTSYF